MGSCVSHYSGQVRKERALSERKGVVSTPSEKVHQPLCEESTRAPAKPVREVKTSADLALPDEEHSQTSTSTKSNTCSPTYTNLGVFRTNITPPKQPRNPKILETLSAPVDPVMSDYTIPRAAPPLLPKKTTALASTEPSLGKQPKTRVQAGGTNLCVVNPVYNLDSNWETNSQNSILSTESQSQECQYIRSLGGRSRPANSLSCLVSTIAASIEADRRGTRSTECLLSSSRKSAREQAARPRGQPLHGGPGGREEMAVRIRRLHCDMLLKLAGRCEERFTAAQTQQPHFSMEHWADFRLTSSTPCCKAGDAHYYSTSYAKEPHHAYAIKVCKCKGKESHQHLLSSLAVRQSAPPHFNVQQDCGHFLANLPQCLLPREELEGSNGVRGRSEADTGEAGAKNEKETAAVTAGRGWLHNTGSLRSCVVIITQDVPFQTVADFVREGVARHAQSPELYERQVCLLLLQLCQGLEHMKQHHITHCNLRLENLLLVPCQPGQAGSMEEEGPRSAATAASSLPCPARLLISNFTRAKLRSQLAESEVAGDWARIAPEIAAGTQYRKCDEFQTGILIYEMLHLPNPFEDTPELKEREYASTELPPLPARSLYSEGLQMLAHSLLRANPSDRLEVAEARACLQCLLWGPRDDLFRSLAAEQALDDRDAILQNWLDLKQTLMMIKFAERSLDAGGVSLEDWLCCQYLAFSTTDSLTRIVELFQDPELQKKWL